MNPTFAFKALKTTLFLGQRFLNSPLRDGILPDMPVREFEGSCLLITAMEDELTRRKGASPVSSLDTRYHQTMERCRAMSREELRAEVSRLDACLTDSKSNDSESRQSE